MSTLETLSRDLAQAVEHAGEALVHIKGHNSLSGIVWHEDGLVVTSARIALGKHPGKISADTELVVADGSGTEYSAKVLGVDPRIDIGILKVEGLKAASSKLFAPAGHRVQSGEIVLSLGRPGKVTRSAFGLVSAVSDAEWQIPGGGSLSWYLDVDGNLPEGFSGGPLIAANGQILGMNTIAMPRGTGMTVPIADISRTIEAIRSGAVLRRYYLGINSVPVPQPRGLMVTEIDPGSPADKAGLLPGDIVQKIGNHELKHYGDLMQALETSSKDGNGHTTLQVFRAGKAEQLPVELAQK